MAVYWKFLAVKLSFIAALMFSKSKADEIVHDQLPFCKHTPGIPDSDDLVIVSTLDGRISAYSLTGGKKAWDINTEPLLSSNLHHIELTSDGQWARLVPSLSGALYRLTADYLEPLPINAEHLLSSSFKYSDQFVIAGARESRWLGVEARSGRVLYSCGSDGCHTDQHSQAADSVLGELLVLRHNANTVRAVDPRSGSEKWNFSVSEHQISLSDASQCHSVSDPGAKYKISLVVPDGRVKVHGLLDELLWEKQLYVQESLSFPPYNPNDPNFHLEPIEWKPVEANRDVAVPNNSELQTQEAAGSTALATLYGGGNYPLAQADKNHGYFLFASKRRCDKENPTFMIEENGDSNTSNGQHVHVHVSSLWFWWKEVLLIAISSALLMNLMIWPRFFAPRLRPSTPIPLNKEVLVIENHVEPNHLGPSQGYTSRYLTDFQTERFIGRGGFGVVFEARKNIDQRSYAVKRITLPQSQKKKERVLREVLALAHLEHDNIVRYYGSWVETPPPGWQQLQDTQWNRDVTGLDETSSKQVVTQNTTNKMADKSLNRSVMLNIQKPEYGLYDLSRKRRCSSFNDSSCVTFERTNRSNSDREPDDFHIVFERSDRNSGNLSTELMCDKRFETVKSFNMLTKDVTGSNNNRRKKGHRRHWSLDMCVKTSTEDSIGSALSSSAFLYIQMQLCRSDLRDWLRDNTNIPHRKVEITKLFSQIVSAVEYVHNQGLIHRDLKPSNILFAPDGRVKVGDFGLVTARAEDCPPGEGGDNHLVHTGHTNLVGTHLYMSPEQLKGRAYSYKVDIYSLGIILFELLHPFNTDMERARKLQDLRNGRYPKEFIDTYPDETETLKRMLIEDPRERFTASGVKHHAPLYQKTEPRYHYTLPPNACATIKNALSGGITASA